MKIYFASDAHLGARFHKDPLAIEKKLVRWLDSIKEDASAIWFLGDLFDYWYEYKQVRRAERPCTFSGEIGRVSGQRHRNTYLYR